MPAYVTMPGTSGNYFSTPDVNLLDADTAHLHQSIGQWQNSTGTGSYAQSQDLTPVIGDYHGECVCDAVAQSLMQTGAGAAERYTVSPNTEYSVSIAVASDTAGLRHRVRVQQYTGAGASIGTTAYGSDVDNATTDLSSRSSLTWTTDASAASIRILVYTTVIAGGNLSGGEVIYWDAPILRTGATSTFVRSLRVTNDLEIEWKAALDDYTPAVTNTILDCLNSNDGYRVRHTTGDAIEIAYGNGSSTRAQSSSATALTDGEAHVFKVTVDQSTGAVVYYIDGAQHDTDTMTTGAGSRSINDLVVGANAAASANWMSGDLYYAVVRDGIGGLDVARFDADDWVGV